MTRLLWLAVAAVALALLARLALGRQAFSIYGAPLVALLVLPLLVRVLSLSLAEQGRRRRLALLCALPALLLATGQIAYWALFFSGNVNAAVMLGVARGVVMAKASAVLAVLPLLAAAPLVWLVATAACRNGMAHDGMAHDG